MKIVDIGHNNYSLDNAMVELETAVSLAMHGGTIRVIKVIHGVGSGAIRGAVRVWCSEQSGRFKAVIYGEDYGIFHPESMDMRTECGIRSHVDYGTKNRGMTFIWLY
ncbi:MAG: Smr/MutS family protein [Candidatus Marinimicrobia bacterium]|jgi:hypothetical protein|nr:Smr/MutS family protein [Candidatus Neomarinimicrobiota bacterium]MBT3617328.1 Smr/MutS family protein [Candidatus Neomarinimicrobiota bacterium]MBT3829268.1 Smr/MutS family protein [Candidatus Neomarinimicrobiota bacterium]MBT3998226.1 Smr/MutS family protein [Candidatus Neomarinimicrobiota bacterium]MBT4281527.1 Smr/MutS family protein [Candidatus Neomarinimicrobiota bacterium]